VCVCVCCVKSKGGIERAVLQEGTHCRLKRRATSQIMLTAFLSVLRPQVQPPDNIHGSNKQKRASKHDVNAVERPLHAYMQRKFACAYIYRHAPIQTYIHAFIQAWGMCRHKVLHRAKCAERARKMASECDRVIGVIHCRHVISTFEPPPLSPPARSFPRQLPQLSSSSALSKENRIFVKSQKKKRILSH